MSDPGGRFPQWWGWDRVATAGRDSADATVRRDAEARRAADSASRTDCGRLGFALRMNIRARQSNAADWAKLRHCAELAGEVLPPAWWAVEEDSAGLEALMDVSGFIEDARIVDALTNVVATNRRPLVVRQAALVALASRCVPIDGRVVRLGASDAALDVRPVVQWAGVRLIGRVPSRPNAHPPMDSLVASVARRSQGDRLGRLAEELGRTLALGRTDPTCRTTGRRQ